jgi:hypothetical protein
MKIIFFGAVLLGFCLSQPPDRLTGKWQSPLSEKGNTTTVIFKADQNFEGFINKKPFATGVYRLQNNEFIFTDTGCEGKTGSYELVFFAQDDSLRFRAILDSCAERKAGMEKLVLGRIKGYR